MKTINKFSLATLAFMLIANPCQAAKRSGTTKLVGDCSIQEAMILELEKEIVELQSTIDELRTKVDETDSQYSESTDSESNFGLDEDIEKLSENLKKYK